jgi:hypothetical protein
MYLLAFNKIISIRLFIAVQFRPHRLMVLMVTQQELPPPGPNILRL